VQLYRLHITTASRPLGQTNEKPIKVFYLSLQSRPWCHGSIGITQGREVIARHDDSLTPFLHYAGQIVGQVQYGSNAWFFLAVRFH
jgi:hypothetical protein